MDFLRKIHYNFAIKNMFLACITKMLYLCSGICNKILKQIEK